MLLQKHEIYYHLYTDLLISNVNMQLITCAYVIFRFSISPKDVRINMYIWPMPPVDIYMYTEWTLNLISEIVWCRTMPHIVHIYMYLNIIVILINTSLPLISTNKKKQFIRTLSSILVLNIVFTWQQPSYFPHTLPWTAVHCPINDKHIERL